MSRNNRSHATSQDEVIPSRQTARWLEAMWRSGTTTTETRVTFRGSSMEPRISDGDVLFVEPICAGPRPVPGEIVVARFGPRLLAHRLVDLHEGFAVTKGDACSRSDPPVPMEMLLGRVVRFRPGMKRILGLRLLGRMIARMRRLR